MKFCQLIECNMRNIFVEKPCTKCGGEASPRPLSEKLKLSISLDQYPKVLIQFVFIVWQVEGYHNISKLSCGALALTSYWALENKRRLELFFLPHFPHKFWRKRFLLFFSINWPNFIVWLLLLCEILGNMCIAIVC